MVAAEAVAAEGAKALIIINRTFMIFSLRREPPLLESDLIFVRRGMCGERASGVTSHRLYFRTLLAESQT